MPHNTRLASRLLICTLSALGSHPGLPGSASGSRAIHQSQESDDCRAQPGHASTSRFETGDSLTASMKTALAESGPRPLCKSEQRHAAGRSTVSGLR